MPRLVNDCRMLTGYCGGVPHVGTHGIRHRSTTDIANSGVPTKVGMKLTGHQTVGMFMHYVHTEDKPVRDAAALVASRRLAITGYCAWWKQRRDQHPTHHFRPSRGGFTEPH